MAVVQSLKNPTPLVGLPHGLLVGFLVPGGARGGEDGEDFQGDFCDVCGDVLPTRQVGLVADAADETMGLGTCWIAGTYDSGLLCFFCF